MGMRYAFVHSSIHLLTIISIIFLFKLSFFEILLPVIGGLFIDIDHLPLVRRHGIRKAFSMVVIHGFGKIRKYSLHNYGTILISIILGFLAIFPEYFLAGIFFLSLFFHLLWDLVEDVVVFRVRLNHWKL